MAEPIPADVRRLVIAARRVVFEDQGREAMSELDKASEEFASRVPWDNEPERVAAGELCFDCPPARYPTDETRCTPCPRREHHNQYAMPVGPDRQAGA